MISYEQLRQRHIADALRLAPEMIEAMEWSEERLVAERRRRLRKLVLSARSRSRWHGARLAGVDVDRLDEITLRQLPVMTKHDLMEHFDEVVTDDRLRLDVVNRYLEDPVSAGYLLGHYHAIASSGSTGRRGVFVYDWREWAEFYLGVYRRLHCALARDPALAGTGAVMANVSAANPTHATAAIGRTFSGPHLPSRRLPVTMPLDEIVAGLNDLRPAIVHGYSSMVHILAGEARAGRLRIAPKRIWTSAEPLLPETRALAEDVWGVPVGNLWGTSEAGGVATPCERGSTHLSEDLVILEPVDDQGRAVEPGTRSAKVYLTNLYNTTMPLIRYEITDEVTVLPDPCSCGSAYGRVADIQGRLDDTFVYHGVCVHPHVFRSHIARRGAIVEYQVRQTTRGAAIAVRAEGPLDTESLARDIATGLAGVGVREPDVSIHVVPRLERQLTGKLKRFVPIAA
jgi:phenylacetate-coenzyme A ligase PaaK-like adenylate-forming protein